MDTLIDFLGRDTFIVLLVYVGSVIRAGNGEKVAVVQGLILAFTPFFVVTCLLYLVEGGVSLLGMEMSAKVMGAFGGLGGFLGNSWIAGLRKDGQKIEEMGAAESLTTIIKSIVNFKKSS